MNKLLSGIFIAVTMFLGSVSSGHAATKEWLDYSTQQTLQLFKAEIPGATDLLSKSSGVLVYPSILKAGLGWGGEYGEGAMITRGNAAPTAYYNIISLSFGFQFGIQSKSMLICFLTDDALKRFQNSSGWKAGVDGSITVIGVGANIGLDTEQVSNPIVAVVFDQKGLMYNLTLEGSKISQIFK